MASPTRCHVSTSAATYAEIVEAARARGESMSAFVTAVIEMYTPPVGDVLPVSLRCTGCKRPTLHRRMFVGATTTRWKCDLCGRSKLTAPEAP